MNKQYCRELRRQVHILQKCALEELKNCSEKNKQKIAIAKKQIQLFGQNLRTKIRNNREPKIGKGFEGVDTIVGKLGKLYIKYK